MMLNDVLVRLLKKEMPVRKKSSKKKVNLISDSVGNTKAVLIHLKPKRLKSNLRHRKPKNKRLKKPRKRNFKKPRKRRLRKPRKRKPKKPQKKKNYLNYIKESSKVKK